MAQYIYHLAAWPDFTWDQNALTTPLSEIRFRQGLLLGQMKNLGFSDLQEAQVDTLTLDVVKSSEIEGVNLNLNQVRSSIAKRLGVDIGGAIPANRNVEGIVAMTIDATQNYDKPLTKDRLCTWQAKLFPSGKSGLSEITVGNWRDDARGPMQVVSGPYGREQVHYEAPSASLLEKEMSQFLQWANESDGTHPLLRAALVHLWFVTIHPFEDGNGRIARAIADWALARADNHSQRFFSMSAQIRREREDYYDILEIIQAGTLDITQWMTWFLGCLGRAVDEAESQLATVLHKARFWHKHAGKPLNDRQQLLINKLLNGFHGKLTSTKWAKIAKCSQDTAIRDIRDLIAHDMLHQDPGGGRNTSYSLTDLKPVDSGVTAAAATESEPVKD